MTQARVRGRKYLTASDDPAPIVIMDLQSSFWRSRDRRENKPPIKLLESASLGKESDSRRSRNKDKQDECCKYPTLAWLEVKLNRIQKCRPDDASWVVEDPGGRCVEGRNGEGGKLFKPWSK